MFSVKLLRLICSTAVGIFLLGWSQGGQQNIYRLDGGALPFPFEIKREKKYDSPSLREATILLSKQYYFQENLSKLFSWYMKKYPDRNERLMVNVYLTYTGSESSSLQFTETSKWPAAAFFRQKDSAIPDAGDNAWFYYYPLSVGTDKRDFLQLLESQVVVILRGAPSLRKNILWAWETPNRPFKIKVSSYEAKADKVIPKRFYYSFECLTPESAESDNWQNIMTFRQNELVEIPREQVRFVNDQVGYVFMGWMYAVTTNGGRTWSKWDAETALPNWQCCDPHLIQDVKIDYDGLGILMLKSNPQRPGEALILRTKDFGQHWTAE